MQKPLWHFDAEYMTASFIINCFLFLVLVFNQASIYDDAAISAKIFFKKWQEAEENEKYKAMKKEWKKQFG
ncbi:hypothetical protein [Rickettsia endosymbiont of Nabis limbatus]|uniref:hypothetical protein n=1 Tax=Rickettsia endosymbiont of Nabis limbatus TaxID=3066268 RepID=UPI003AF3E8F6